MGVTAEAGATPAPQPEPQAGPFLKGPAGVGLRDVGANSVSTPSQ
jgi:hypothetical protein